MKKLQRGDLLFFVGLVFVGCSSTDTVTQPARDTFSPGPKGQFECADRSGDGYINQTELVYLRQCGISEDLTCGDVPAEYAERPAPDDFELGLRFLQVTDADGDERISTLEFRAHCNKAARAGQP